MARTNNLTDFLNDVSSAIKEKIGDSTPISASDFDTEIMSIETAGNYQTKSISITTNGDYDLTPDQNYDAMDEVNITVNVPAEDLTSVLNTQDQKIAALETLLQTKAQGPEAIPNIYMQDNEPTNKNGIWLKMSDTEAEHYISDEDIFIGGTFDTASNIPYYFYSGSAVAIGTNIYIFGGNNGTTRAYKYDTLTDTYTQLTNIPYSFYNGSAVAIGNDVYLFGSTSNTHSAYKYNTLNDTYTQLTNIPHIFHYGCVESVGTDIYLLGGDSQPTYNYKYNTLTDTYTRMIDIPFGFKGGSVCNVGTDIYLLGSSTSGREKYAYKYDTFADTYTRLTNIPYNFYDGSAVSIGTDIYLLGGSAQSTYNYKYNTLTDTYAQLTNIPYSFYHGSSTVVGTNIYLLGGGNNNTSANATNEIYYTQSKSYTTDNTVVISQGKTYDVGYNIKLFNTNFEENFQPLYRICRCMVLYITRWTNHRYTNLLWRWNTMDKY